MDENKTVKLPGVVTVKKFSELLGMPVTRVITELMRNKIIASINEEIDFDTASIIAQDLGYQTTKEDEAASGELIDLEKLIEIGRQEKNSHEKLAKRPPVVTILGHVDHGKTSLLDAIKKTNVAAGEKGGITQHIRAYQVKKKGQFITFIDTPGHEAFSSMRERGVSIADIAVLVVAADDGVRPQTKEVIEYLKAKQIPAVVAINKVDKPEANVQRVKQELAENEILVEDWGGKYMSAEVSAKTGLGIEGLLESILLLAEVEDFKSDDKRDGLAVVLESHLDHQKGPVATVLVKTGQLRVGQDVLSNSVRGRIKKMEDPSGKNLSVAGPSTPVTILGLEGVAQTNDIIQIAGKKMSASLRAIFKLKSGNQGFHKVKRIINADEQGLKHLPVVIKADVQGSLEAIQQILSTIKSEEVALNYINLGIGNITESDVRLAETSGAVIYGFSVMPTAVAKRQGEESGVEIAVFDIIYELVADVKERMAALLPPEVIRTDLGKVKVLAIFKTGKKDMIVGGRINEGKAVKGAKIEVLRDKEVIGQGILENLQHNKENAAEVSRGNECGITFQGPVKLAEGDSLVVYQEEERLRKL